MEHDAEVLIRSYFCEFQRDDLEEAIFFLNADRHATTYGEIESDDSFGGTDVATTLVVPFVVKFLSAVVATLAARRLLPTPSGHAVTVDVAVLRDLLRRDPSLYEALLGGIADDPGLRARALEVLNRIRADHG